MKLTIYNTSVKLESQKQLNRLLDSCDGKGLDYSKCWFLKTFIYFRYSKVYKEFSTWRTQDNTTQITEQEFLTLLEEI